MTHKTLRVLLVEDDQGDAYLTRRALSKNSDPAYQVDVAASLSEASRCLNENSYDVALLDLGLPDSVGIETLSRFGDCCPEPVPVIVLTNLNDEQAALESLDNGAQDYLIKNLLRPAVLSRAIRYALQRKQLVNELQAANELLDSKNVRLSELYDTAQQFVDNVSHEFRTPLTVIREFTSIVRDGYDGPVTTAQSEHLDKVLHRTDDLALMVDDMLDISKLEAGLLGIWRRPCCAVTMLNNVAGLLRARAESKQIRISTRSPDSLPLTFCDGEKAQRVLINLAVNAVKFTPEGGSVDLWARCGEDGDEIVVGVTDSGPGICRSNLESIFKRFQQGEANLRSSTKGFGLGLNIAKELVQLNLGQISVESEVGRGSTFSFTIPRNDPTVVFNRFVKLRMEQPGEPPWITLITASVDGKFTENVAPVIDEFLQRSVRASDLVIQAEAGTWLLAVSCSEHESASVTSRLERSWQEYARNYPSAGLPSIRLACFKSYTCDKDIDRLRADWNRLINGGHTSAVETVSEKTVLVVDDDKEVNACLGLRLQAAGYHVLSAFDGDQGLSALLANHPDAVVLDVRMPNMDGLTMLRELRNDKTIRNTPVVVLSASIRDQHQALEAGANYFVTKPYESQELLSAIESSLMKGSTP